MKYYSSKYLFDSKVCNYTNLPYLNELTETEEFKIVLVSLLGIIFIVSVTGNIFTCYVILTRHLMKNTIWIYLFILSIADGSMTLSSTTIAILATFDETFLCIQWLCGLSLSTQVVFGTFSIYTIVAISIYKLNHISEPLASLADNGMRSLVYYIVLTTIIAFGIALPPAFGFSGFVHFPGRKWCSIWSESKLTQTKILLTGLIALGYAIPFFVITGTSIRTFVVFRKHNTGMKEIRRFTPDKVIAENRAILQTLFLIVAFFISFWTPLSLYALLNAVNTKMPLIITHVAFIMMFSQGCVNPMIYCFKHRAFRKIIRKLIRGRRASTPRGKMTQWTNSKELNPVDEAFGPSRNMEDGVIPPRNEEQQTSFTKIDTNRDVSPSPKCDGKPTRVKRKERYSRESLMPSSHINLYYIPGNKSEKEEIDYTEPCEDTTI